MRSISSAAARRAFLAISEPSTSRAAAAILRRTRSELSCRASPAPLAHRVGRLEARQYATVGADPAASTPSTIPPIGPEDTYDIVIIGGANAGLALACALLSKPSLRETTRILLLEGGSLDKVRSWTGEAAWENRVSSLTAENVAWLKGIGAWKHIAQHRSCPVEEMIIWANPSPDSAPTIHFPPLGHPMAHMTENANLQRALLRRIDEINPGTFHISESSRVSEMQLGPGGRWVGLRIGEDKWVRGSVVVGADGPNSPVRKFSDIDSYGHAYNTHAVVATLHHDEDTYPNNTAFQRFLPTGPLAFLPLSPTASTMVWSTHPTHAAAYKKLSPEALVVVINAGYSLPEATLAALSERILAAPEPLSAAEITATLAQLPLPETREQAVLPSTVKGVESVASFPLKLTHADSYLGDRTVLVGDAAHTVHPLAGQGLNMGLADVQCLANVWEDCRRTGADLGSQTSMAAYPRERYPANHLLLSTTDKLHYIFRSRSGPVNWARGVGLDLINEIAPLKKLLMSGAGASAGARGPRQSEKERLAGRSPTREGEQRYAAGGWPVAVAGGLENWLSFKATAGMVAGIAGEAVVGGLRRFGAGSTSPRAK